MDVVYKSYSSLLLPSVISRVIFLASYSLAKVIVIPSYISNPIRTYFIISNNLKRAKIIKRYLSLFSNKLVEKIRILFKLYIKEGFLEVSNNKEVILIEIKPSFIFSYFSISLLVLIKGFTLYYNIRINFSKTLNKFFISNTIPKYIYKVLTLLRNLREFNTLIIGSFSSSFLAKVLSLYKGITNLLFYLLKGTKLKDNLLV
ncbi:hypothetical protein LZ32DRAFT_623582 [Colletotrichum eremochloae]|nr:hypothetical protein LZ32DRAFT_623582 [Colletotrichum eremochloae]